MEHSRIHGCGRVALESVLLARLLVKTGHFTEECSHAGAFDYAVHNLYGGALSLAMFHVVITLIYKMEVEISF